MKCINTSCDRESYSRGLCSGCYKRYGRAVKLGKTTWEKLEVAGLSIPADFSTRIESSEKYKILDTFCAQSPPVVIKYKPIKRTYKDAAEFLEVFKSHCPDGAHFSDGTIPTQSQLLEMMGPLKNWPYEMEQSFFKFPK